MKGRKEGRKENREREKILHQKAMENKIYFVWICFILGNLRIK
jgi:hypothetical protein